MHCTSIITALHRCIAVSVPITHSLWSEVRPENERGMVPERMLLGR